MITTAIFDMDDLMLDSAYWHNDVFEAVLKRYGSSFRGPGSNLTPDRQRSLFSMSYHDIFAKMIEWNHIPNSDPAVMAKEFADLVVPVFEKSDLQPMPGLISLVRALKKEGITLVIGSSANRDKIDVVLKRFNLTDAFQEIVSKEDVHMSKPNPEIFLKAAQKVHAKPHECVVFEDAENGVIAAKNAGMKCIGVHNMQVYKWLGVKQDLSDADIEVNSLEEISVDQVLRTLQTT